MIAPMHDICYRAGYDRRKAHCNYTLGIRLEDAAVGKAKPDQKRRRDGAPDADPNVEA